MNIPSFDPSKQKSRPSPNVWTFKITSKKKLNLKNAENKRHACVPNKRLTNDLQ